MGASRISRIRPHRIACHVANRVGHHEDVPAMLVQIAVRLAVERIGGGVVNHLRQVQHLTRIVDAMLFLRQIVKRHVVDRVVDRVHVDRSREGHPYAWHRLEAIELIDQLHVLAIAGSRGAIGHR